MQSKLLSFLEAITNTIIGFVLAAFAQLFFFSLTGIVATFQQSILVTIGMAGLSLVRGYLIRRVFNKIDILAIKIFVKKHFSLSN